MSFVVKRNHVMRRGAQVLKKRWYEYFAGAPKVTESGIAVIVLEAKHAKMNTLNQGLQAEVESLWQEHIAEKDEVKGVVFMSGKPDNFIAGADIKMLKAKKEAKKEDSLYEACMSGHQLFDRLRASRKNFPIVAAIHGSCLGGGLEWALKCDSRIATSSAKTKLGLPEVKLGLLPGWGGTYALPRLIGAVEALPLILQGSEVRADKAKRLGLVDEVCDLPALEAVAVAKAEQLAKTGALGKLNRSRLTKRLFDAKRLATERVTYLREYVLKEAKKKVDKTTRGKYAAPYAIIECIGHGLECGDNAKKAFEFEANAFVKLAKTDTSTALIGLFDGLTATKKNRFAAEGRKKKDKDHKVCVLGAGLMGAGIAQVSAERGMSVLLKDRDATGVGKGLKYIGDNLDKKVKRRRLTQYERNLTLSRVSGYDDNSLPGYERRVKDAQLVIEAVFENLDLKHKVLRQVEKLVSPQCVIATNTSALPITNVAQGLTKKDRVLGMHYFSPVPQMQLLEIIPHAETSDEALGIAFQVGIDQGKTCILVKDVPGFYVNRALAPQMAEIGPLFADGVDPAKLDAAILDLGMPVGPITLLDEVGADVGLHVQNTMIADPTMDNRMNGADPAMLQAIVDKGWLGRKAGKGFFLYDPKSKSKKKEFNPEALEFVKTQVKQRDLDIPLLDIQDRYLARFVNEAAVCLQEGIIDSPQDGDLAAVFGVGFLPFTGGPFRMLDARGVSSYVDRMIYLADTYGPRFTPCQLLLDHAKSGAKFYPTK